MQMYGELLGGNTPEGPRVGLRWWPRDQRTAGSYSYPVGQRVRLRWWPRDQRTARSYSYPVGQRVRLRWWPRDQRTAGRRMRPAGGAGRETSGRRRRHHRPSAAAVLAIRRSRCRCHGLSETEAGGGAQDRQQSDRTGGTGW